MGLINLLISPLVSWHPLPTMITSFATSIAPVVVPLIHVPGRLLPVTRPISFAWPLALALALASSLAKLHVRLPTSLARPLATLHILLSITARIIIPGQGKRHGCCCRGMITCRQLWRPANLQLAFAFATNHCAPSACYDFLLLHYHAILPPGHRRRHVQRRRHVHRHAFLYQARVLASVPGH